jgi:hypothetical protein
MNEHIVFVGYSNPLNLKVSVAGINYFNNLKNSCTPYIFKSTSISLIVTPSYPRGNLFIKSIYDENHIHVGFINFPIIKFFSQIFNLFFAIKKVNSILRITKLVTFNFYFISSTPILLFKLFNKFKAICVVADLPISDRDNFFYRFFNFFLNLFSYSNLFIFDSFIVVNTNIVNFLRITKPYYLVEGGITSLNTSPMINISKRVRRIFYSGTFNNYSGVYNFCVLFTQLTTDIKLVLCGSGEQVKDILKLSNPNIIYMGNLEKKDILKMQRNSFILVNPKDNSNLISSLTFPSKLFEYINSQTLIISTMLPFKSKINESLFLYNDLQSLKNTINLIDNLSNKEYKNFSMKNISVLKEYIWKDIGKKIHEFIIS